MKSIQSVLKSARIEKGWKLREASAQTGIDQALISKYEKGDRLPPEKQLPGIASAYDLDLFFLRQTWLAEKIGHLLRYEIQPEEILHMAESRIQYLTRKESAQTPTLDEALYAKLKRLDALKRKWIAKKPLNQVQLKKIQEYFRTEYTYESNRIEGNTLSLQETHLVINEGLTIGGKSMTEHLEAINHAEAISLMEDLVNENPVLNKRNLLDLHALILKGIDRTNAGKYRTVEVRISGSKHTPPGVLQLDRLMMDYFRHYQMQKQQVHPVILAAGMHERLVSIHPFVDGNGRTARLVMNLILLSNGYTIASLKGDHSSRLKYYRALEKVQVANTPKEFYHLVIDAARESLEEHLKMA